MNLLVPSGAIPDSAWPGWGKACGWPQGGGRMGPETHSFVSAFNRCLSSGRMLGSVQGLGTGSSATRRPESRPCGARGPRRRRVAAGWTRAPNPRLQCAHGGSVPALGRARCSLALTPRVSPAALPGWDPRSLLAVPRKPGGPRRGLCLFLERLCGPACHHASVPGSSEIPR